MATTSPVDLTDYTLAWPRDVFVAVAKGLLADPYMLGRSGAAPDVVELLLQEAFVHDHVAQVFENETWRDELPADWVGTPPRFDDRALLHTLVANVDGFPAAGDRSYFSERRTGTIPKLGGSAVRTQFVRLIDDMYTHGYFDKALPKGCVDEPASDVDPDEVLTQLLGRPGLWPLRSSDDHSWDHRWGEDTLFDLIEVFHDLASRPRSRGQRHNWNNCGWHFAYPDRRSGQLIYRWRINDLLDRSEIPYRLADAGEDLGRLIAVTDDARAELAATMTARTDLATADRVRHALALFRARASTEHDKRSAIITLAGVLEEHRSLLKAELLRKDEGALFNIANNFAIRHQRAGEQGDYDPMFLDWVFWSYLSTIELTDRLLARQVAEATP